MSEVSRRRASWASGAVALGAALLVGSVAPGCVRVQRWFLDAGDEDAGDAPGTVVGADAARAVLASVGERVVVPALSDAGDAAATLVAATDALATSGSTADRDAARAAWRALMLRWERVELLSFGPGGLGALTPGGMGMRDDVYAWPLFGRCRVDQATVAGTHADTELLRASAIDVRGLGTIEYLLFYELPDNGCPTTSAINLDGSWDALGAAEIAHRRAVYAHTAAVLVAEAIARLATAWDPAGGNFLAELSHAGAGSLTYPTAQEGLNAISDALLYIYKEVTDIKLGVPAGLRVECAAEICPDRVESRWAGFSLEEIRANVEAFRDVYLGAAGGLDGAGFDDLLRSIGAGDLDARIRAAITTALAAIDAVSPPLDTALSTDYADVLALYEAIRALGDLFKVEVLTLLNLELPNRLASDND